VADHVDIVLAQWHEQRPDLDVASMAVIARLSRLSHVVTRHLRATFAAHDLDPASFDLLATLRRTSTAEPLTPTQLVRSAMVTSGAISQRLDRLEGRGLVSRLPAGHDGRVVHVVLTAQGRDLIDRALPDHVATLDRLVEGLPIGERAQLADLLRRLLTALGDSVDNGGA
jgi:DNA-binding MarR family transcriptional regulator